MSCNAAEVRRGVGFPWNWSSPGIGVSDVLETETQSSLDRPGQALLTQHGSGTMPMFAEDKPQDVSANRTFQAYLKHVLQACQITLALTISTALPLPTSCFLQDICNCLYSNKPDLDNFAWSPSFNPLYFRFGVSPRNPLVTESRRIRDTT